MVIIVRIHLTDILIIFRITCINIMMMMLIIIMAMIII